MGFTSVSYPFAAQFLVSSTSTRKLRGRQLTLAHPSRNGYNKSIWYLFKILREWKKNRRIMQRMMYGRCRVLHNYTLNNKMRACIEG